MHAVASLPKVPPGRRAAALYDSGWKILLVLVGGPLAFFVFLYVAVHLVFWALARGSEYRSGQADFPGVPAVVGANAMLPGIGLMLGGFPLQGWACLSLWIMVTIMAIRYASLPGWNLLVVHGFAAAWAGILAAVESRQVKAEAARPKPGQVAGRLNALKQRVPTMEDPDLYPVRLEAFQLALEAAADADGRFDAVQNAAINRLRNLLRIEEKTFARLLRQIATHGAAHQEIGEGARQGRTAVFERLIELAVDHPAFRGSTDAVLEAAGTLMAIPVREARGRREAYEKGETYRPVDAGSAAGASPAPVSESQDLSEEDLSGDDAFSEDDLSESDLGDTKP